MVKFCSQCSNLMVSITSANSFRFQCVKCAIMAEPKDEDTLLYSASSGTNLTIYRSIVEKAAKDPVNPKVEKKCSCGNNIARQIRLGSEMILMNVCTRCENQWIEGSRDIDQTE